MMSSISPGTAGDGTRPAKPERAGEILVVGSVALDAVETPFGQVKDAVGGAAVYFSAAASLFAPVRVSGVVGDDYPLERLAFLRSRGVDLSGLEKRSGSSFRWSGVYSYDLNSRETLSTELGVFADFRPELSPIARRARWVFLGNIDPNLQLRVLDQVEAPAFVACDTMNYWIEREHDALLEVLARVDMVLVNDAEARELSGDPSLARAARWILERGPLHAVIKKGEHGALLASEDSLFFAPGYPLDEVLDPTGAGDAFAGGVLGHLATFERVTPAALRRAVVYGCALGAFTCEAFGPARLEIVTSEEVVERVARFRRMTHFEVPATL